MIVTNLRSSSINTFKSCPMSYFFEYVLGWDSGVHKATIKGSIVHKVLELLAIIKKADQDGKSSIRTDLKPATLYVKNYLTTDRLIDKLTSSVYKTHTQKYALDWKPADKKDCIKWVNKVLGSEFDPRKHNIIDAEGFFDIEIVEPWAAYNYTLPDGNKLRAFLKLKGTIDVVTQVYDAVEIIDYKTGKRKDWVKGTQKSISDIKDDIQPRMYHYVISKKYPNKQVIVTMFYVNDGGAFSVYYNKNDLDKTKQLIQHYFKSIQQASPICSKSWRCSKFCEYGKTTFEDTKVAPIIHNRILTKCEQLQYILQHKTEEDIMTNMCYGNLLNNLDRYHQG